MSTFPGIERGERRPAPSISEGELVDEASQPPADALLMIPERDSEVEDVPAGLPYHDLRMSENMLCDLLVPETLSARLARMLTQTQLGSMTYLAYLEQRQETEAWMLGQRNCGRHTVRELRAALDRQAQLQSIPASVSMDMDASSHISMMVDAAPAPSPVDDAPPVGSSTRDVVEWHLANLPPRTAEVLTHRFGLDCEPQTLAQIGEIYSVTRERIRQIEAKALKRIRAICHRHPIDDQLNAARRDFVEALFGDAVHVTDARFESHARAKDGHLSLALEFACLTPKEWLAGSATKMGRGWLRPGVDAAAVATMAEELAKTTFPFPHAAEEIVGTQDGSLAFAAAELLLGWHLEGTYLFERRPRTRLIRTASLHGLLSRFSVPTEVSDLLVEYRAAVPTDQCSDRDLVIVMEVASHLFIETYEGCWAAVGRSGDPISRPSETLPPQSEQEVAHELDDMTIAFSLERELRRAGPSRVGHLINRAIDIVPSGRSANSVGPTLLLHPSRFVRVLPGVYALPEQVLDERRLAQADNLEYLLNPHQARLFALARWAGEPWGSYPLWTITAEMRLCRWARASKQDELLRSLLAVASIKHWPTDDIDRLTWLDVEAVQARFELEFSPRKLTTHIPLDRVLAAGLHLVATRSLGWMIANRILGYRPDASAAAGLLSGMVGSGMAASPADRGSWQRPHHPGPALEEWIARLSRELHSTGELSWDNEAGSALVRSFEQEIQETPDVDEDLDEFELMMADHRRSVQSRRHEARLEMALD